LHDRTLHRTESNANPDLTFAVDFKSTTRARTTFEVFDAALFTFPDPGLLGLDPPDPELLGLVPADPDPPVSDPPGAAIGTALRAVDGWLVPTAVTASTSNEYDTPFVRLPTTHEVVSGPKPRVSWGSEDPPAKTSTS
jgi:hypothetical protein